MIKMDYDARQVIKKVVEQNLTRPWEQAPSIAAGERYRKQVDSAIELFRVVVDHKQPIYVMANSNRVVTALQTSLGKKYKLRYVYDQHGIAGVDDCVVINVLQTRPCERFDAERKTILEYLKTRRNIDFWTFGDF